MCLSSFLPERQIADEDGHDNQEEIWEKEVDNLVAWTNSLTKDYRIKSRRLHVQISKYFITFKQSKDFCTIPARQIFSCYLVGFQLVGCFASTVLSASVRD